MICGRGQNGKASDVDLSLHAQGACASFLQYRAGSPDGYGVLQYVGSPNNTLPAGPPPQPGSTPPFTTAFINQVRAVFMYETKDCHVGPRIAALLRS